MTERKNEKDERLARMKYSKQLENAPISNGQRLAAFRVEEHRRLSSRNVLEEAKENESEYESEDFVAINRKNDKNKGHWSNTVSELDF